MAEYTQIAMKAMTLADLFNMVFKTERITGAVNYRVELSAPDGPSTAGGKQALQHIKLIPEKGGNVIVAGGASRADNRGEIRTFQYLEQLHLQRYRGASFPLNRVQYEELMRKIQRFLADQNLIVEVLSPPPGSFVPDAESEGGTGKALSIAIGVLIMLLVGGGVFFFLSSR